MLARRCTRFDSSLTPRQAGCRVRPLSSAPAVATSKNAGQNVNALWLNRPDQALSANYSDSNQNGQEQLTADIEEYSTLNTREASDHVTVRMRLVQQTNNNKREGSTIEAATKCSGLSDLWMNAPGKATSNSSASHREDVTIEDSKFPVCKNNRRVAFLRSTWLDLQTNNNRRKGRWTDSSGSSGSSGSTPGDYEIVSDLSDTPSPENTSAVARGADAMVKNSLSRQTQIIDTSKLVEEGKVSTEYIDEPEFIEEQDRRMIDDYEKTFAYARRLRALLNMKFNELDKGTVDTNFLLIKAHEHPTQLMIDRWRNVDYGVSYNDQVKRQKQIEDYRTNAVKKKEKKGEESEPFYPDNIRFTVRIRKENSEKRWKDYLAYRKKQKKLTGKKSAGPVPKPNDKYVFAFQDIWSFCIAVYAKPWATVREIIDPVFARTGLARRADFIFTIGAFNNDKRAGKAKILGVPNLPEELTTREIASDLYKKNCTEIYVNDNRCDMFRIFPSYYNPSLADKTKKKKKGKKKSKADKAAGKDKSNAAANAAPVAPNSSRNNDESVKQSVAKTLLPSSTPKSPARPLPSEAEDAHNKASVSTKSTSRRFLSVVEETSRESVL